MDGSGVAREDSAGLCTAGRVVALGRSASADGVSVVLPAAAGAPALLLGSIKNAFHVCTPGNRLAGLPVHHILSVGSSRNAQRLVSAAAESGADVRVGCHALRDRLRDDEHIDVQKELGPALCFLKQAMVHKSGVSEPTSVLVQCDMGVNRSPTVVLAYLLLTSFTSVGTDCSARTLRDCYRLVLAGRPDIDPLPAYRRSLRQCELENGQVCSVGADEHFGWHLSELLAIASSDCCAAGQPLAGLDEALELRQSSVSLLLEESTPPWPAFTRPEVTHDREGGQTVDVQAIRRILDAVQYNWSSAPGSSRAAKHCAQLLSRALDSQAYVEVPWAGEGLRCAPPAGLETALASAAKKCDDTGFSDILKALEVGISMLPWKHPKQLVQGASHSLSEILGGDGKFCSAMIVGMRRYGAILESTELLMGLTWLAPGTFYPQHAHDAAEVYQMLLGAMLRHVPFHLKHLKKHLWCISGCGEWGQTVDLLQIQTPGTFRDHPSATPHTIRAPADTPLLAWYAWTGDLGGEFWFCDCNAGDPFLATIATAKEPEGFYDNISLTYTTVMRGWGYCMPEVAADALEAVPAVSLDTKIVDLGCGNGLVGSALMRRGYRSVYGVDISRRMLECAKLARASTTGDRYCYEALCRVDIRQPLPFADCSFGALFCIGTTRYLEPSVLQEWLRVVVADGTGLIVFTHESSVWPKWEMVQASLCREGKWMLKWQSEPMHYLPVASQKLGNTNERAKIYVYERLSAGKK